LLSYLFTTIVQQYLVQCVYVRVRVNERACACLDTDLHRPTGCIIQIGMYCDTYVCIDTHITIACICVRWPGNYNRMLEHDNTVFTYDQEYITAMSHLNTFHYEWDSYRHGPYIAHCHDLKLLICCSNFTYWLQLIYITLGSDVKTSFLIISDV
jgi:hypothetical protein